MRPSSLMMNIPRRCEMEGGGVFRVCISVEPCVRMNNSVSDVRFPVSGDSCREHEEKSDDHVVVVVVVLSMFLVVFVFV